METRESARVKAHLKIAKRLGTQATLTLAEWNQTISDFKGMCAYCLSRQFEVLEHFISVNIAGTHAGNCLPACSRCNSRKRDLTGETLIELFGREVIVNAQKYLLSRAEQSDNVLCVEQSGDAACTQYSAKPRNHHRTFKSPPPINKPLSLTEAANALGVSEKVIYRLMEQGELHPWKLGKSWKFDQDDINAYVEKREAAKRNRAENRHVA